MGNRTIAFLLILAVVALITLGLSIDAFDDQSIRRPTTQETP